MGAKRVNKQSQSSGKKLQKPTKNDKAASTITTITTDTSKKSKQVHQQPVQDKERLDCEKSTGTSSSKSESSKMTLCTIPTTGGRPTRRPGRPPSGKRLAMTREMSAKMRSAYKRGFDPCDNSNDSGLGFDHHTLEQNHHHPNGLSDRLTWSAEQAEAKRQRMDIKLENDDINEGYCFPARTCKDTISLIRTAPASTVVPHLSGNGTSGSTSGRVVPRCTPLSNRQSNSAPVPLTTQLSSTSRYIDVTLMIVKQPEQQHRARYQTEGSRGAVKDREGNGFPIVQLTGYYKPATLQVFIGTDVGKVAPHMFYQACKVSGKNSTPCVEKKIDGTCVIELQLDPSKEMSATCDCVGILKERNVDVEHRFPDQLGNRSKKKSTKCRMIFRTTITLEDGTQETLQVCSQPIVCTQPPGVPEICKKSLTTCPASGGLELFVLGKNFLKDTKVLFQQFEDNHLKWEQAVVPDKEYLQQTHFVCVVPQYRRPEITEPVAVRLCVISSGKTSESHQFVYTPVNGAMPSVHDVAPVIASAPTAPQQQQQQPTQFMRMFWQSSSSASNSTPSSVISKREQDLDMMPPPESNMVPLSTTRRPSISLPSTSETHSPPLRTLKQEYIDESSQNSVMDSIEATERYRHISESSLDVHHGDSNMSMINDNSMDMLHHGSMMNHHDNSNLSMATNEDSVEMIRRNSISNRSTICENSMDIHMSNSNISMNSNNDDSSCSTTAMSLHNNNSSMAESMIRPSSQTESGIDLRMKMPPIAVTTAAVGNLDLNCTSAPSMATLQHFGMINNSAPPPSLPAQSVENYLTKIEKTSNTTTTTNTTNNGAKTLNELLQNEILNNGSGSVPVTTTAIEPNLFLNQPMNSAARPAFENLLIKTADGSVADQTRRINAEKLDDLINSTVESHIGSPRSETSPKMSTAAVTAASNVSNIIGSDVMLNPQLVTPIINTTLPSALPLAQELATTESQQPSATLSPEVLLNTQMSPNLICPQVPVTVEAVQNLLTTAAGVTRASFDPEKAVLLEATVDLLQTQKKINELAHSGNVSPVMGATTCQLPCTTGNNFVHSQQMNNLLVGDVTNSTTSSTTITTAVVSDVVSSKAVDDFVLPIPVKDINNATTTVSPNRVSNALSLVAQNEGKTEDRIIPFTNLSENELINYINPKCFDQV